MINEPLSDIHSQELQDAEPGELPEPTYWPFYLAMGIMFLAWGLLTMWEFSLLGIVIMIIALIGWINILRHEK
jgi:hypothetical protein